MIDSLAEIRKYLCNESKNLSCSNVSSSPLSACNQSPSICIPKLGSFSKSIKFTYSPIGIKEAKCVSLKECNSVKPSATSDQSEKQFESKSKESALESDKQDSGLDSDHQSLNKHSINWVKQESGDELLQLLDEISQRTEVLQKQLAVIDQKSCLDEIPGLYASKPDRSQSMSQTEVGAKAAANCANCSKIFPASIPGLYMEGNMEKNNSSTESPAHLDGKSLSERVHKIQKRTANKIDSAMVSSILKETNVVDLQRQVLIYLVENAVLHTKLGELEQLLSSKTAESDKIENSLKDEARLLMMENRELRISLDEQKLETNSLRSKVLMLERVLQSISVENRELTWQLGESLGIQNLNRKEPRKFSAGYAFGNPTTSKFTRRSSLPPRFACQNETNVNCVKSKLLSNANSFLDVTVEEPEHHWVDVQSPATAYENHGGPIQSSTPFTKLKDVKNGIGNSPTASNFQSVKKRFKPIEKDNLVFKSHSDKRLDEVPSDVPSESCVKNSKFNSSNFDDSAPKFPFNSILEKLKSNSDYRLSRRTSLTQTNEVNFSGDALKPTSFSKTKLATSEGEESVTSTENLRQNGQTKNFQARKGKNIHQRIQDILDRIMAESEETT